MKNNSNVIFLDDAFQLFFFLGGGQHQNSSPKAKFIIIIIIINWNGVETELLINIIT